MATYKVSKPLKPLSAATQEWLAQRLAQEKFLFDNGVPLSEISKLGKDEIVEAIRHIEIAKRK